MWLFKKAKDLKSLLDHDHRWSMLEANDESGPMLIRINDSANDWAAHPKLGIRVGFAVPLKFPNPSGLPEANENAALGEVEDFLVDLMESTGPAIQVLAITTGTFKEFVFYMQNAENIESAHKQAMTKFPDLDIQCYGESDPNWQVYRDWRRA
ncbi:DUF695 domain-containing protein [Pseudomonas sp. RL_15y_Pfl2_60]|uniref:DUF695 domain-containing protein n=1 Tax=Pseudomonas sp. RL_15y_Pfl2_60 TaxID=3088709 RepID=UPI0030DB7EFF